MKGHDSTLLPFTTLIGLLLWTSSTEGFPVAFIHAKKYGSDFYGGSKDLYDNYM